MPGDVSSFFRLIGAAWVLVRHDALIPHEVEPLLPPSLRAAGRTVRLFAGREARKGRPGQRLARAFEELGPAAIKIGQLLATRADVFGLQFADDLGHLKDRLPPFPLAVARAEVERSLDRPVESLFLSFEPAAAAASLAQAHPAVLNDGRKVAVKVLRPGVEQRVATDLGALRLAAGLAYRFSEEARRLESVAFADTVARSLELELDLRLEAAACSELGEVMAEDGYMAAPAVVWAGVAKRVMVTEWIQGSPLSSPATLQQPGFDRHALADNIVRAFLTQALDHGVFHADLHEGNLFAAPPDKLYAVDFGIVGRLGAGERRFLAEILWGFLQRDYRRVAQVHFDAGYVPARHSVEAFAQALRAVGEPVAGRKAADVSMGRLLGLLFEITAVFDMHLRPELVLLQKTMASVEGVARRIDPEHDIWSAAKPVVERWIARELSPLARARRLADQANRIVDGLARWAENPASPPVILAESRPSGGLSAGLALGLSVGALAIALIALSHAR
jgi:ubiquinone biosynthesis protein